MKNVTLALMLLALPFQAQSIDLSDIVSQTGDYLKSFKREDKCQQLKNDLLMAIMTNNEAQIKQANAHKAWLNNPSVSENGAARRAWQDSDNEVIYTTKIVYILNESLKACEELQKKA